MKPMPISQEKESATWWDDADFQNTLVTLLVNDYQTLKNCASFLTANDFKPSRGTPDGRARWLVAERALEFYEKHNSAIGKLIRSDVMEYGSTTNLGAAQVNEAREFLKKLNKIRPVAPDALVEKVVKFKRLIAKKEAINDLSDLLSSGNLSDEQWDEITARIKKIDVSQRESKDYFNTLEERIARRVADEKRIRAPWTLIDPLDAIVRTVSHKQIGMILATWKRGKSTMLLWLAVAMILQRLNVLYVTLEDPLDVTEDRLDSIITSVPLKNLLIKPNTLRSRFTRYRNMIHANIRIFDGTEGGVTMRTIEQMIQKHRNEGFITDVVIIDYDEEVQALRRYKEKRFESDEVYRNFRTMCSSYDMIGWMAAQTVRNMEDRKIVTGSNIAEDIGKIRKVTCCISMGKGDWGDNGIYLYVAAHKTDRMKIGCNIIPDLKRSLIYDRDATTKAMRQAKDDDDDT